MEHDESFDEQDGGSTDLWADAMEGWGDEAPRYALLTNTLCQGLVVAAGDIYDTRAEAQAELDDLRRELAKSRAEDGCEPEDGDDFSIEAVERNAQGQWITVKTGESVTTAP